MTSYDMIYIVDAYVRLNHRRQRGNFEMLGGGETETFLHRAWGGPGVGVVRTRIREEDC